jgi:hypothetical protein
MMPRASNRVADEQAVLKRGSVVRAGGAYGEHFRTSPRQHYSLVSDMTCEQATVFQIFECNTLGKIWITGACGLGPHLVKQVISSHDRSPELSGVHLKREHALGY